MLIAVLTLIDVGNDKGVGMKLNLFALLGILVSLWFQSINAEEIRVGLERFPPLITNEIG